MSERFETVLKEANRLDWTVDKARLGLDHGTSTYASQVGQASSRGTIYIAVLPLSGTSPRRPIYFHFGLGS